MRTIAYNTQDKDTASTDTLVATDEPIERKFGNMQRAYEAGFSESDGVRGGTVETNGRIRHPEKTDDSRPKRTEDSIEDENPGLADN